MGDMLADQPLAIMPAALATKLLLSYINGLTKSNSWKIITAHIRKLEETRDNKDGADLAAARRLSLGWLQERELIDNIIAGNWDKYEVKEFIKPEPQIIKQEEPTKPAEQASGEVMDSPVILNKIDLKAAKTKLKNNLKEEDNN